MRKPRTIALSLVLLLCLFPPSASGGTPEEESKEKSRTAEQFYNTGYLMILLGRPEEAIQLFKKSLEVRVTAEAHTYMGWALSHMGEYKKAIEEAERAIRIDPDFGNPYNDIGVYLIDLQRFDEAVPWLEQAMTAKRYDPRHFPYFNLGRVYMAKGHINRARELFQKSLEIEPRYTLARQALEKLRHMVN